MSVHADGTRRILITGGAGFIGYHLATRLAGEPGVTLTLVDSFRRGRRDEELSALLARPNVELIEADLARPGALDPLGGGFHEVYHLAGVLGVKNVLARPEEVMRVNVLATLNVAEWFARGGGEKLLFASTSEVYAWTQKFHPLPVPTPEAVPLAVTDVKDPRATYAGSKICGELLVTHSCGAAGKPYTIVRYHNVYGPRMGHEHVIPELYQRVLVGEDPLKVFSFDHVRAFCYVTDAVEATAACMRGSAADGETFNVGNDEEPLAIGELAGRIVRKANRTARLDPVPAVNDPIKARCPDVTKLRELLGYRPRVTLDEGLDRTLAWYAKRLAGVRKSA
jgi:UDP-glucose 4-epimerase/UDP-glucuronate decarboxylase